MASISSLSPRAQDHDERVIQMRDLHEIFRPFEGVGGVLDEHKIKPKQPQWYLVCAARSLFWALDASGGVRSRLGNVRAAAEDLVRYQNAPARILEVVKVRPRAGGTKVDRSIAEAEAETYNQLRNALAATEKYLAQDIENALRMSPRRASIPAR